MQLTVARLGRPQGLRGEVALDLRTDDPEARLAPGTVLTTKPAAAGPLTVDRLRRHRDHWYASFAEISDRSAAEAARGVEIVVEAAVSHEPEAWYPHELVGLRVELENGDVAGEVVALEHAPAHDLLIVREPDGRRSAVPFVRQIVPVVDPAGGRVVLTPPGGLLAADAARLEVAPPTPDGGGFTKDGSMKDEDR